ncbi:hypothetical protein Y032_0007g3216 [Ancylostoma ceylanicum]|uniref:Uncharacterized protein n=1 Tax=Ancylostoma ceylanicum TaxID=53326 RepID=A0A016VM79_9BILA|nr:hypothetical protein Y032_0007g3216 [Ancylostoma ceylanicum]
MGKPSNDTPVDSSRPYWARRVVIDSISVVGPKDVNVNDFKHTENKVLLDLGQFNAILSLNCGHYGFCVIQSLGLFIYVVHRKDVHIKE